MFPLACQRPPAAPRRRSAPARANPPTAPTIARPSPGRTGAGPPTSSPATAWTTGGAAWWGGVALPAPRFAGFDLEATAGALQALDASAWVSGVDGQATHSTPKPIGLVGATGVGSSWDIDWVAPDPGVGPVTFYLAGNV